MTYGSINGSRFSSDFNEHIKIDSMTQDVYLNSYGIPWKDVLDDVIPSDLDEITWQDVGFGLMSDDYDLILNKLETGSYYTPMIEFPLS